MLYVCQIKTGASSDMSNIVALMKNGSGATAIEDGTDRRRHLGRDYRHCQTIGGKRRWSSTKVSRPSPRTCDFDLIQGKLPVMVALPFGARRRDAMWKWSVRLAWPGHISVKRSCIEAAGCAPLNDWRGSRAQCALDPFQRRGERDAEDHQQHHRHEGLVDVSKIWA